MKETLFANEVMPEDGGASGDIQPGVIYAANSSRFSEAHFSEPLTQYSVGWRDMDGMQELLDFIAPPVEVPRKFEYAKWENNEAFNIDVDDIRAIGSDFKRVELTQTKVVGKTLNKGLIYRVDEDNVDTNSSMWREKIVNTLQTRLIRSELRRSFALLVAAATNVAKTWDSTAGKNPDGDVRNVLATALGVVGIPASNIVWDLAAWNLRLSSHESQNTASGFGAVNRTPDQAAQLVGGLRGMISRFQYQLTPTTKESVVGGALVLVFLAKAGVGIDDPSNIKRFVSNCVGGTRTRVYEQRVSAKITDISVEHYSLPTITSTAGIYKLTIS